MYFKFLSQTSLTFLLMQCLNFALDEFIFFGISKVTRSKNEQADSEQDEKKSSFLKKGLKVLNGRLISNFSNVTNYAHASAYVLGGLALVIYVLAVFFQTWRFIYRKNKKISLLKMDTIYANVFIFASIWIYLILAALFYYISTSAFREYKEQTKNFNDFKSELDELKIFNEKKIQISSLVIGYSNKTFDFNDQENKLRISQSIAKLETYFYMKYFYFKLSMFFSFCTAALTIFFLFLEFC